MPIKVLKPLEYPTVDDLEDMRLVGINSTGKIASLLEPLSLDQLRGKSAYDVAVDEGFEGSVTDWLASLKGEKGDTGDMGPPGPPGEAGDDTYVCWILDAEATLSPGAEYRDEIHDDYKLVIKTDDDVINIDLINGVITSNHINTTYDVDERTRLIFSKGDDPWDHESTGEIRLFYLDENGDYVGEGDLLSSYRYITAADYYDEQDNHQLGFIGETSQFMSPDGTSEFRIYSHYGDACVEPY